MKLRFLLCALVAIGLATPALAGSPSGNDWFQILASPFTGGDNTGDGGTGAAADFNYYYVGQSFTGTMQINVDTAPGSSASNIWVDYATPTISITNLTTGAFYPSWSGQVVSTTIGRVYSTGFDASNLSLGQGTFGTINVAMTRPSQAAYGTATPAVLDINIGTVGNTTESNISYLGADLLDDAEDFQFHVWADTKKPYATNPVPTNGAVGVAVESLFTFDLRDSKNGEGDNTGVGTGVNTTMPPGAVTSDDGGGPVSLAAVTGFVCSGIWGTNLCQTSVNPDPPSGIAGDTRNWAYSTTYTLTISAFRDLASASQDQLGDANGPNIMDTKIYTFTTEADLVAPQVVAETPVRASGGNSVSTNLIIDVTDRKTYPNGPSGTGLAPATCSFNVSSASFPLTTYTSISAGVTVTSIPYGYRYTINPVTDFAENETISVSAFNCADVVGNVMTTDNWTFTTADSAPPYVTDEDPSNDETMALNDVITFHIKDDGAGVDIANTVIYVNGIYYTSNGGAGSVTTAGTKITFASSLDFDGGNYAGDTTARSGTSADTTFTIDQQANFTAGEAIPIAIYTRDLSGNLMERVLYAAVATGVSSSCLAGSSYCGAGTSFNGSQCTASGASCSTSSGSGSGGVFELVVNEPTIMISQIDESSVLVTWMTNHPATSLVAFDTKPAVSGTPPAFDYRQTTGEDKALKTVHAVRVTGLEPRRVYYFRPVSRAQGHLVAGNERQAVTRFPVQFVSETVIQSIPGAVTGGMLVCPEPVVIPRPATSAPAASTALTTASPGTGVAEPLAPTVIQVPESRIAPRLTEIRREGSRVRFRGVGAPGSLITITVY